MRIASFALGLVLSFALGCTPSEQTPVPSKGVLKTKGGRPCDNALVVFHPLDVSRVNGPKPVAKTDGEGNFVLRTFSENDGALPGEYAVTVVWPGKDAKAGKMSMTGEGEAVGADQLKGKFGDPSKPLLKATIPTKGATDLSLVVD
jgi:hypothetical protein